MNHSTLAHQQRPMPTGILVLMGSGELSSSMVEVHKSLLRTRGPDPSAVFIDTPAGFQQNVDEISQRAQEYFVKHVGHPLHVVSLKSRHVIDSAQGRAALKRLEKADYILMGPGSPTYAVRQWIGTPVPHILRSRLESGAVVVAASAAALSTSWKTLPVYEIYKVGMDLHWADGLGLLGPYGLRLVIVPHWNNAEGGTHDTRYCYMGAKRFQVLESLLPQDALVLGLDEHTALVLDFVQGAATVRGVGTVTLRRKGSHKTTTLAKSPVDDPNPSPSELEPPDREKAGYHDGAFAQVGWAVSQRVYTSGQTFPLRLLWALTLETAAESLESFQGPMPSDTPSPFEKNTASSLSQETDSIPGSEDFWNALRRAQELLERGLEQRLPEDTARALLDLDRLLWQSAAHGAPLEDISQGREIFREGLVQAAQRLTLSFEDKRTVLEPLVDDLVRLRQRLRDNRLWEGADALRTLLAAQGVAIDDTPSGPRRRWVNTEGQSGRERMV
ncbi:MAG: Type 1 glutamine amidotransferase-like domain-containing protein [Desulfosoma sp.]|uniref:Type 1 glutamine amidotransferase-like domain-containing protein n=1 Tax=Desulfosoma sp. TaxID=2603217 RepID=UPI00404A99F0